MSVWQVWCLDSEKGWYSPGEGTCSNSTMNSDYLLSLRIAKTFIGKENIVEVKIIYQNCQDPEKRIPPSAAIFCGAHLRASHNFMEEIHVDSNSVQLKCGICDNLIEIERDFSLSNDNHFLVVQGWTKSNSGSDWICASCTQHSKNYSSKPKVFVEFEEAVVAMKLGRIARWAKEPSPLYTISHVGFWSLERERDGRYYRRHVREIPSKSVCDKWELMPESQFVLGEN